MEGTLPLSSAGCNKNLVKSSRSFVTNVWRLTSLSTTRKFFNFGWIDSPVNLSYTYFDFKGFIQKLHGQHCIYKSLKELLLMSNVEI